MKLTAKLWSRRLRLSQVTDRIVAGIESDFVQRYAAAERAKMLCTMPIQITEYGSTVLNVQEMTNPAEMPAI